MPARNRKRWVGRIYRGIDSETGQEQYEWIGRFATRREREAAVARRRVEIETEAEKLSRPASERITCAE